MRAVMISGVLPIALALAACDSGEETTILTNEDGDAVEITRNVGNDGSGSTTTTIKGPDGEEIVQRVGTDVPVSLPDGFSVYPNAKVVTNSVTTMGNGSGSMVMLESDASPEQIADFYKDQAEKAGMEVKIDLSMEENRTVAADRESDGTRMTVSASRDEDDESTTIMLNVVTQPDG